MTKYLNFLIFLIILSLGCDFINEQNEQGKIINQQALFNKNFSLDLAFLFEENLKKPRLKVEISFEAPGQEKVYMAMPDSFLRKTRLYERIEDLVFQGADGKILRMPGRPNIIVVQKPLNSPVKISYFISPFNPQKPDRQESFYAPLIKENYFQFVGSMGLILPFYNTADENEEPNFAANISWNLPLGFEIYNSYSSKEKNQHIKKTNLSELRDALFVGGKNIVEQKIQVGKNPVNIIFKGSWEKISYDDFSFVIQKLLETQRDNFRDDNFPYFLVSLLQKGEECFTNTKFAGTAHLNSFRAYYPKNCPMKNELKQLISHEFMHTWIGKKIKMGKKASGGIEGKWFTEGFTDYFSRLCLVRSGLIRQDEYFQSLNHVLEKYGLSKEKNTTLEDYKRRVFKKGEFPNEDTSDALEDLPYQQGEILAWQINRKIKDHDSTKSLDDVLRDMLDLVKQEGHKKYFDLDGFYLLVKKFVPEGMKEQFNQIISGATLYPPSLSSCALVKQSLEGFSFYELSAASSCDSWLLQ